MKRLRNILPLLVILGGMLILFYPTISNFLIMRNASRAVNNYDASVEALSQEQYQKVLDAAHAYNEKLAQNDAGETTLLPVPSIPHPRTRNTTVCSILTATA